MATSAPSSARPSAIAFPIPRPPPVINATRRSSDIPFSRLLLSVGEHRRSLLRERGHGFGQIAGKARQDLCAVLEVDAGLEAADLELAPHDFLRHADAEGTVADNQLRGLERRTDDVAVGHD